MAIGVSISVKKGHSACQDPYEDHPRIMHVRLPGDMYLPSPLGRFRVPGVVARWAATSIPPPEQRPDRHRATSSPRRSWRLERLPALPDAAGARNGSQRVQPPSDVARPNQILLAGQ